MEAMSNSGIKVQIRNVSICDGRNWTIKAEPTIPRARRLFDAAIAALTNWWYWNWHPTGIERRRDRALLDQCLQRWPDGRVELLRVAYQARGVEWYAVPERTERAARRKR